MTDSRRVEQETNGWAPYNGTSIGGDIGAEGGAKGNEKNVAYRRSTFRNRLSNFKWPWYACTMSTGGLAIVLSETPHQFYGLETIGKVFFVIELVLFTLFTCTMIARFTLEPKALQRSLVDPAESFFFGCFWLSQATIIANTQRYAVPACGPWLIKTLEVIFWYYVGCTLLVAIFLFTSSFATRRLTLEQVQPSWVLAIYPIMLAGTLASLIAPSQPTKSALPIIIGGIAFQGVGFMVAFLIFAIVMWRFFSIGLPPPSMRNGMFIMVGTPGYTGTALSGLAEAAVKHFPPGYMGVDTVPAADVLVVLATAISAFLWIFSFILFCWSAVSVLLGIRKMKFDETWWAAIFPNAGWVVATGLLGQTLQSQGIQWIASAQTILLVVLWLLVAAFHLKAIIQGQTPPAA